MTTNPPNKYDLSFADWFRKYGWRIHSLWYSRPEVWSNDSIPCPFKITEGMLKRLEEANIMTRFWPDDISVGDRYWTLER